MKQLIILAACLPIMFAFLIQSSLDQMNQAKVQLLTDIVYSAKEEARQEGCFTEDAVLELKNNIHSKLGANIKEIRVEATGDIRYRIEDGTGFSDEDYKRGLIYYKVTVPIGKMMAMNSLFGIRDKDNIFKYTVEGYAASERLP